MSDDAPAPPKKLTVEDLVLAQQRTQKALENVVERLDMMVDRESGAVDKTSDSLIMFRVFGALFMLGSWYFSLRFGDIPVLIFISFILFVLTDGVFSFATSSARQQDTQRRVRAYWEKRNAELHLEAMRRRGAQFAKYQARIKSAIASSRWFPTNWR